jgi:hypothetical protein
MAVRTEFVLRRLVQRKANRVSFGSYFFIHVTVSESVLLQTSVPINRTVVWPDLLRGPRDSIRETYEETEKETGDEAA